MSALHYGLTPKMKPISPRRSGLVAALDVGSSKVACLIARLRPHPPQQVLMRRSHAIEVLGFGHTEARGTKAGAVVNLAHAEESIRQAALLCMRRLLELPLLLGHHLAREGRGNRKGQAHRADRRGDQDTFPAASGTLHAFLHYRLSACLLSGSPGGAGFVEGWTAPASVTGRPALMADSRAASEKIPRVIRASEFCARAR